MQQQDDSAQHVDVEDRRPGGLNLQNFLSHRLYGRSARAESLLCPCRFACPFPLCCLHSCAFQLPGKETSLDLLRHHIGDTKGALCTTRRGPSHWSVSTCNAVWLLHCDTIKFNTCKSRPFSFRVFHRGVLRVVDHTLGINLSECLVLLPVLAEHRFSNSQHHWQAPPAALICRVLKAQH